MPDSPFIGPSYNLDSRPASVQRTVNMMPVPNEPGNERAGWTFKDVPGLVKVNTVLVPDPPPSTVILRLPFDTDYLDKSTYHHAHTRYTLTGPDEPLAALQSINLKYGTGAYRAEGGYTSGTANAIQTYANGPECELTSDFTIQMWLYLSTTFTTRICSISSAGVVAGFGLSATHAGEWGIAFNNAYSRFVFYDGVSAETFVSFGSIFPNEAWFHIAVVRESGIIKTYLNGVHSAVSECTLNVPGSIGGVYPIALGGSRTSSTASFDMMQSFSAGDPRHSYIDDVMISAQAEYTADFTPPTQALRLQ